jgi:hypothetical protein
MVPIVPRNVLTRHQIQMGDRHRVDALFVRDQGPVRAVVDRGAPIGPVPDDDRFGDAVRGDVGTELIQVPRRAAVYAPGGALGVRAVPPLVLHLGPHLVHPHPVVLGRQRAQFG